MKAKSPPQIRTAEKPETQYEYKRDQIRYGLEIGDEVNIVNSSSDMDTSYLKLWEPEMDAFVGKQAIVKSINYEYIVIEILDIQELSSLWAYPFYCLKKVN